MLQWIQIQWRRPGVRRKWYKAKNVNRIEEARDYIKECMTNSAIEREFRIVRMQIVEEVKSLEDFECPYEKEVEG